MLAIFDFDGTLTNSAFTEIDPALFSDYFRKFGLRDGTHDSDYSQSIIASEQEEIGKLISVIHRGGSNEKIVSAISEITGLTLPKDSFEELVRERVKNRNTFLHSDEYQISPNAIDCLSELAEEGVNLTIATNSPAFRVMRAMRLVDDGSLLDFFYSDACDPDLSEQFEKENRPRNIFGAGDTDLIAYGVEAKPSPYLPVNIAHGSGYRNFMNGVIFIGDAISDIECAKSAGIMAVGYTGSAGEYGAELSQEMIAAGADSVVGDFENLKRFILQHENRSFVEAYRQYSMHI